MLQNPESKTFNQNLASANMGVQGSFPVFQQLGLLSSLSTVLLGLCCIVGVVCSGRLCMVWLMTTYARFAGGFLFAGLAQ
jgi:hypothetical protein